MKDELIDDIEKRRRECGEAYLPGGALTMFYALQMRGARRAETRKLLQAMTPLERYLLRAEFERDGAHMTELDELGPNPMRLLRATLPTREAQENYERELVRYMNRERGVGINVIKRLPMEKEKIRRYLREETT
jgi:hypothetical protein